MGDKVVIDEQVFTDIADAIRDRNGETTTYKPGEMAAAIATVGYSLEDVCNNVFTGDIVFTGTKLIGGLFYKNNNITSFTGNNVINAMGDITGIGAAPNTFLGCTNLISVSMPSLKDLYHTDGIFKDCTKLKTVNMDWMNMTRLGTGIFQNCSSLEKTTFVLPKIASPVYGLFITNNANLLTFDIGGKASGVSNFMANAFSGCSSLNTIIIRDSNIRPLGNISAFTNTPFASGNAGGTLYVPSALISTYQSATNWSTILGYENNNIVAIESSQYATKYADGTAIE